MEIIQCSTQVELTAAIKKVADNNWKFWYDVEVHLIGNDKFEIYDSSQVTACNSSQVRAYGSSQVRAYDSSQVAAYDSSQVTATKFVAVSIHGTNTKVTGGHKIVIPTIETPKEWCEFYGIEVQKKVAILYKGVNENYEAQHNNFKYVPGTTPIAPDWNDRKECGGGLHFSPRPEMTLEFAPEAIKFLACPVKLSDIVVLGNKVKAKGLCAPCYEVDKFGNKI